jgi:hypothetical protein
MCGYKDMKKDGRKGGREGGRKMEEKFVFLDCFTNL